jgi:exopolysaccharide biosynthesis polyprenyl glycosylphosphotransferase
MNNTDAQPSLVSAELCSERESSSVSQKHAILGNLSWFLTFLEMIADGAAITGAVLSSYGVYRLFGLGLKAHYSLRWVQSVALGVAVLYVILLDRDGVYRQARSLLRIRETESSLRVAVQVFLLILPVAFFANVQFPRWVLMLALVLAPAFQIIEKQLVMSVLQRIRSAGFAMKRVVIYGAGASGRRVYSAMMRSPKLGLRPVAFIDDDPALRGQQIFDYSYRRDRVLQVARESPSVETLQLLRCDFLVLAISNLDSAQFAKITQLVREANANLCFISPERMSEDHFAEYVDLDGVMLGMARQSGRDWYGMLIKRPIDCVAALMLILVTAPVWMLIALLVRMDSKGPIFFTQRRAGGQGKHFDIYKFRSMYVDAPKYARSPTESEDPRITKVGRFLRRTSLDELPQLLNVLKGDMSLVGPRPEMAFIVENYSALQKQRLQVTPGITGLWQLSGDRSEPIHENIQYDLYYIRHRGFFMDCAILIHTFLFAMHGI